jgi:hypothetical protein
MAVTLSSSSTTLLPPTITGPIFAKATEMSAVMQLSKQVDLPVGASTAIPIPLDVPVADWVAEAGQKPVSEVGIGVKTMQPHKVAVIIPVSDELARQNPGGVYDQVVTDLPTAIARSIDYAAINGKSLRTGNAGPFPEYLAQTPNSVALGTTASNAGGLYVDLATGMGKVVDANYDFTGFAADKRLLVDAMLSTDSIGRPLFVGQDTAANLSIGSTSGGGYLAGVQAYFSQGVSGRYWRAGDSVQTLTITGTPTGGTYTLSSGGNTTTLAFNAANSTIQTAVRAWGGIYSNVTVTGTGPFTLTFTAATSNVAPAAAPFSANGAGLTGGTNSAANVVPAGQGGVDTNLRAIGGDWTQAAVGVAQGISLRISQDASYFDGTNWHSAFSENLTLVRAEMIVGFVVGNTRAFCAYTKGTAAF